MIPIVRIRILENIDYDLSALERGFDALFIACTSKNRPVHSRAKTIAHDRRTEGMMTCDIIQDSKRSVERAGVANAVIGCFRLGQPVRCHFL